MLTYLLTYLLNHKPIQTSISAVLKIFQWTVIYFAVFFVADSYLFLYEKHQKNAVNVFSTFVVVTEHAVCET